MMSPSLNDTFFFPPMFPHRSNGALEIWNLTDESHPIMSPIDGEIRLEIIYLCLLLKTSTES